MEVILLYCRNACICVMTAVVIIIVFLDTYRYRSAVSDDGLRGGGADLYQTNVESKSKI